MGAAIPIIGAVAGAAGTVANISAQKQQAQAQQEAIDAQTSAVTSNTNLRLIDIERQKQYAQYLAQIDEARRAALKQQDDGEMQIARMRDEMNYNMAGQQNEQAYSLGNLQNDNMSSLARMQNDSTMQIGQAQLKNQYDIGSMMGAVEAETAQSQYNSNYQSQMNQADVGEANAFLQSLGIDGQAAQARFGKQSEAFGVEAQGLSQGSKVLMDVANAFVQNRSQNKQNAKGRAGVQAMMAGLQGGNGSASMANLLQDNLDTDLDQFVSTVMQGGRAAESALQQIGLGGQQADILRQLGDVLGNGLESEAEGTRKLAMAQSGVQKTELSNSYRTATGDLAYKKQINELGLRDQYVLNQLALKDQVGLSNLSNEQQYTLNQLALQSSMSNNRLNINDSRQLNKIGYDTYTAARDMQFGVEQAQTELNKQFYDSNLASSANTIQSSASSELQSLRAARSSISSPGILSYASAGIGAFNTIGGAIGNAQQGQQRVPQMPMSFGTSTSTTQFSPGQVGSSFTGASNYGVLSGYQVGGGY